MGEGSHLVGRDSEQEQVARLVRAAAAGTPGALLVAGEPGVGKTSLVSAVTSGPDAADHLVLWGRCLRFGAESSPYLPVGQLLTQWHRQASATERARVLAGAEQLAVVAPALGVPGGQVDETRLMPLVATVLERIAESAPLVLVVDDVQWADGSSLDLLAYLFAGFFPGQRMTVLVTYRDTELGDGHRLHGWLADVARLPAVSWIRLDRLGYADAEALVERLGPGGSSSALAAEIFAKSDGNPYYTELLVRDGPDLDGDEEGDGLAHALLSSWHRLGPRARELLQVLAVGGRPVAVEVLERLCTARGWSAPDVADAFADAGNVGLTRVTVDGEAWFHHPLVAEVVVATLTPAALRAVHLEYVDILQASTDLTPARRAAHLALHHHGAGHGEAAFTWSLTAADEARSLRGYAEECDHLLRACRLWTEAEGRTDSDQDRIELWQRAARSAWSAGEHVAAVRVLEETIALAEAAREWGRVVVLRRELWRRRVFSGIEFADRQSFPQATLRLAEAHCPGGHEHARALAHVAHVARWVGDADAEDLAREAVELAERIDDPLALAWTLGVWSQVQVEPVQHEEAAGRALALARGLDDPELLGNAGVFLANVMIEQGRIVEAGDTLLTTYTELTARGSIQDALWAQPEFGALMLIDVGRWGEASSLLRELLSHRLPSGAAADVRGVAALLAFRTGQLGAGQAHLDRARELRPGRSAPGELLPFMEIEGLLASGRPRRALAAAIELMAREATVDTDGADELLVIAASAAADLAAHPGGRAEAVAMLAEVEALRGPDPGWFPSASPDDLVHPARERLFLAERARCHGTTPTAGLWQEAVTACRAAGMPWQEATACLQWARSLLETTGRRAGAGDALRRAARLAEELGAAPVLAEVRDVAAQARISLDDPVPTLTADGVAGGLGPLTPREREVLAHVTAGRTYAEIASALFISEKTVSVHVSNLLRKTGTSSRLQLADLARRSG